MKTLSSFIKAPWMIEQRMVDLPDQVPAGHALIRIEACGICGTDLSAARTKAKDWAPFGHEIAGVIEQVCDNDAGLEPGMTVVIESSSFCGHCELCRDGRVDLCYQAPNLWASSSLGFSEYMITPINGIVPYSGLSPEVACLSEPAGVAMDLVKTADIQLGDRVCLIGPGPIGLMAIALASRSGASEVVCIGLPHSARRLEVARQLGAKVVASDAPLDSHKQLQRSFHHVLLTSPVQTVPAALSLLAYGGRRSYIGIGDSTSGDITFDANDFHFRKLQLRASYATPAIYYPAVHRMLRSDAIPGDRLISHTFPLGDMKEAMDMCRTDKGSTLKVVVTPQRRPQ